MTGSSANEGCFASRWCIPGHAKARAGLTYRVFDRIRVLNNHVMVANSVSERAARAAIAAAKSASAARNDLHLLKQPENVARLNKLGFELIGNTPEEFTNVIRTEQAKWGKVIRDNKIRAE